MGQLAKLRLIEGNDTVVHLDLTKNATEADLTTAEVELYLKTTEYEADADAVAFTRAGGEIAVTDAVAGEAEATIDGTLVTSDLTWWRVDVIDAGARKTALYGDMEVINV